MGPSTAEPIVITGATGTIGGASAASLAAQGHSAVLVVRDAQRGAEARARILQASPGIRIEIAVYDLSLMNSVRAATASILALSSKLAGLIHCGAVFTRDRHETSEGFEVMFATNHLGPFLLTEGLLPALKAGSPSRVIPISAPSTTELDFADLQSSRKFTAFTAFGATKTANLLFAYELARRMQGSKVISNVFFPGVVRSRLMAEAPAVVRGLAGLAGKRPEEATLALATLATDPSLESTTGKIFKLTKLSDSSGYSRDPEVHRQLWEASERLVASGTNAG